MAWAKKAFDFFLFSSCYITLCAVLMAWQTGYLFGIDIPPALYGFIAAGTFCSYNFHWALSPPTSSISFEKQEWHGRNKSLHFGFSLLGALASLFCLWSLRQDWVWLLVSALFTFLYSAPKIPFKPFTALRKVAVAKTVYLALAWMHVTVLLPLLLHNPVFNNAAVLFAVNRFFFIYAICVLFDFRDREEDRKDNIRSMVTEGSEAAVDLLFVGSVAVAAVSTFLLFVFWPAILVAAILLPVLALILLYPSSKKTFSHYRYYFVLDGLMMFSAPLVVLAKFAGQFL